MGIARPAESSRIHDMHRLEPDAQRLTGENGRDLGLQTPQECHCRLHSLVPCGVERHDAKREMEPSGVDDDRGVESWDGRHGFEERRLECVDCIAQGFVVALGICSTSRHGGGSMMMLTMGKARTVDCRLSDERVESRERDSQWVGRGLF